MQLHHNAKYWAPMRVRRQLLRTADAINRVPVSRCADQREVQWAVPCLEGPPLPHGTGLSLPLRPYTSQRTPIAKEWLACPPYMHATRPSKRTVPPKLHNRSVTLLTKDSTKATVSRVLTVTFCGVWGYTERAMETTRARTCIRKLLWTRCACLDPPSHHHYQHRGKKSKGKKAIAALRILRSVFVSQQLTLRSQERKAPLTDVGPNMPSCFRQVPLPP
jgi:hypothetical protein